MCVIAVVTIGQRAESLSIRVGADHFLVSHHPGGGVIHLGMEEETVKRTDTRTRQKERKISTQNQMLAKADVYVCFYSNITMNMPVAMMRLLTASSLCTFFYVLF